MKGKAVEEKEGALEMTKERDGGKGQSEEG